MVANPAFAAAIVAGLYAVFTKKITIGGLFQQLLKDFMAIIGKPATPPANPTTPATPVVDPTKPLDISTLLQLLLPLLLKAKEEGNKVDEEAVLRVMAACPHCSIKQGAIP
jgi:hypothetical protein